MSELLRPEWVCERWGDLEHDWLDCFECLQSYEEYLEKWEDEYYSP